jgi:hypothetical protein
VNHLLAALRGNTVSKNGGFYDCTAGEGPDTVYGLAMCPADYSRADCGDCLKAAAGSVGGCISQPHLLPLILSISLVSLT